MRKDMTNFSKKCYDILFRPFLYFHLLEICRNLSTKFENRIQQNFAQQIASDKKEDGTIIIAEKQTSGRGRRDRIWASPKGGMWFSLIIHPKFDVSSSTLVPIAGAVALSRSIKSILASATSKYVF